MKTLRRLLLQLLVLISTALFFSWASWNLGAGKQSLPEPWSRWIAAFAQYPQTLTQTIEQLIKAQDHRPFQLLVDRRTTLGFQARQQFPASSDPGYLLLSGVDPTAKKSVVQLIVIATGKTLHQWQVNFQDVAQDFVATRVFPSRSDASFSRIMHPKLLSDGGLLLTVDGVLMRLDANSQVLWRQRGEYHHSIELDADNHIWVSAVTHGFYAANPMLEQTLRDDAIAELSLDGQLISKISFSKILLENGFGALLLGQSGDVTSQDRIHLNQIAPALEDGVAWKKGDLFISCRHLSTVFLYRPSTGKILWHQTGPWLNQHDVNILDGSRISIFGNDVISGAPREQAFLAPQTHNQVYVYDFATRQITKPFETILDQYPVQTVWEGRARILGPDALFIEDTNNARHLMFSRQKLLWSRLNVYDEQWLGMVSWSSYLRPEELPVFQP